MLYLSLILNFLLLPFLSSYIIRNNQYLRKCWYPLINDFDKKLRILIKKKLKLLEPLKTFPNISEKANPFYETYLQKNNISYQNLSTLNEHQKKLNLNYDMMVLNLNSNLNTGAIYRTGCLLGMNRYLIAGKKIYNVRSMVGYKFCPVNYLDIFPKVRNRMKPETLNNFNENILKEFLNKNNYHIYIVEQGGKNILDFDIKKDIIKNITSKRKILYIMGNETFGVPQKMIKMLIKDYKAKIISIPQWGCAHSFNVSQAANIIMWNHYCNFINEKNLFINNEI